MTKHPIPSREEKLAVWRAYKERRPTRTPLRWNLNNRAWLLNPSLNTFGWTYGDYLRDPKVILETNARFQMWRAEELWPTTCDSSEGLPDEWWCSADVQNCYDAAFYGGKIFAPPNQVPAVESFLTLDDVDAFLERDYASDNAIANNPFIMERLSLTEELKKAAKDFSFMGRRAKVGEYTFAWGFDGAVTAGAAVFGADFFLLLAMDPDKGTRLLEKFTRDALARIRWLNRRAGLPERHKVCGFADDSIQLLSCDMYRELVLPWHIFYCNEMDESSPAERLRGCHLCGDATRHFKLISDAVGVNSFDTGFPVDFAALRRELGPEIEICGGVHVTILQEGTPDSCYAEAARILNSGVRDGGRFVLQEANNLPPNVPLENLQAVYQACLEHGRFEKTPA